MHEVEPHLCPTVIREMIRHENDMSNHRIMWLLIGQGPIANAVAELNAGLNVFAGLFTFLANQFNAGSPDRQTIARTCRSFEDAMREWQRELKKSNSRMGLAF